MFRGLYLKVLKWAQLPQAPKYLFGLSFAESSFFPIPPDVMLAPMVLARPKKAWFLAFITTLASVLGGLFGYFLGYVAYESIIEPLIVMANYEPIYYQALSWFHRWDFWVMFLAGFSPIPYKIFTVAAGVLNVALLPFVLASFLGRGARFFLVAGVIRWGGAPLEKFLLRNVNRLGWLVLALAVFGYLLYLYKY